MLIDFILIKNIIYRKNRKLQNEFFDTNDNFYLKNDVPLHVTISYFQKKIKKCVNVFHFRNFFRIQS